MAIGIPIISTFDGSGIEKAKKEFGQLETASEKAQFAVKKAAVPAAAALAGLAVVLGDAVKGAIADEAAQKALAGQIARTTTATDAQIAANEEWISTQGKLLGVTDDELRPVIAKLSTQTHDLAEAQKAASLAMDISAATGKDLGTVSDALAKAYGGNEKALAKLSPELKSIIKDGASLDEVMGILSQTFGGAASDAAETAEGRFRRLGVALGETKESVGTALLPVVEAILPILTAFSNWAQENPKVFVGIAAAIGAVALSITAVNLAMALNPFTAIAAAVALVVIGVVAAYNKFETFRNVVKSVANGVGSYFEFIANAWITAANVIIRGINLIKPGKDISTIGHISIGTIGSESGGGFTSTAQAEAALGYSPAVTAPSSTPFLGMAPSVSKKVTAAPAGPFEEGYGGSFVNAGLGNVQVNPSDVIININGGDPNAILDSLREFMFQNGSLPISVS